MSILPIMKRVVTSRRLSFVIRFALGFVFIYAGITKLTDPKAFARIISLYDIVPESLLPIIAVGLPAVEFLAGLGLIFNIRGSLSAIFVLLMMFITVLGYGILNDLNIDCGCFSQEEINQQNSLKAAFYRDLILTGGAFFLFLSTSRRPWSATNQSLSEKLKSIKGRF